MDLEFKFKPSTTEAARAKLIEQLKSQGQLSVRQLFPDENDELRDLFILKSRNSALTVRVREWLRRSREIEFVEGPITRKLIR